MDELVTSAEQHLMAHNKELFSIDSIPRGGNSNVGENYRSPERLLNILICYWCGGEGHRALDFM